LEKTLVQFTTKSAREKGAVGVKLKRKRSEERGCSRGGHEISKNKACLEGGP